MLFDRFGGVLSHFEYDALGPRSRKVTETGTTEFIWQGSQLIGEYHNGKYRWYFYLPNSHTNATSTNVTKLAHLWLWWMNKARLFGKPVTTQEPDALFSQTRLGF
ncbi:hypothetical protein VVDAL7940_00210 [Vibrio vulnificus]|nr:hypothetical protein VVDAL7940_00210 [Vibrio vulnificus]